MIIRQFIYLIAQQGINLDQHCDSIETNAHPPGPGCIEGSFRNGTGKYVDGYQKRDMHI